jgi:pimeloyl-ACP methyl ester carboxylesterase
VTFFFLYLTVRNIWGVNHKDLPKQIKSKFTQEFFFKGCKFLVHQPIRKTKRRILLFPGLGISVRRMLQESCMDGFLEDSEIVCFQIRGLGESEWFVDLCSKSMLEDALNVMNLFESTTDKTIKTLFVGYSLGCFVAMQAMAYVKQLHVRCDNIILVNGMCSGNTMISHFKIFAMLLGINIKPFLKRSEVPITLLHAKNDITIPLAEAQELKEECDRINRPCTLLTCEGTHGCYTLSNELTSYLRLL